MKRLFGGRFSMTLGGLAFSVLVVTTWDHYANALTEPKCVARAEFDFDRDGQADDLTILLTSGIAYTDTTLWCGAGPRTEGEFTLFVQMSEAGTYFYDLARLFYPDGEQQTMWFRGTEEWSIGLSDYNHDGQVDFSLGQYHGCHRGLHRFFTVSPDSGVSILRIDNEFNGVLRGGA